MKVCMCYQMVNQGCDDQHHLPGNDSNSASASKHIKLAFIYKMYMHIHQQVKENIRHGLLTESPT
jgi:hypothetical protein